MRDTTGFGQQALLLVHRYRCLITREVVPTQLSKTDCETSQAQSTGTTLLDLKYVYTGILLRIATTTPVASPSSQISLTSSSCCPSFRPSCSSCLDDKNETNKHAHKRRETITGQQHHGETTRTALASKRQSTLTVHLNMDDRRPSQE